MSASYLIVIVLTASFLATFAPDFGKLTGVIDFEREEFNPRDKRHREYAMRDSEGLYHAMVRAQSGRVSVVAGINRSGSRSPRVRPWACR